MENNTMTRREATWAKTGVDISSAKTIDEALNIAGLNYTVEKRPIFNEFGTAIDGHFATMREDTKDVLGLVGNRYTVCQNRDAFEFVNYITEEMHFVKAGQTRTGIVYVIAKFPEDSVLGDKVQPYVIFQNGHTGWLPVKAAISSLRIICQNQFNLAFRKAGNTVKIRHSSTLEAQLEAARDVLKSTAIYMGALKEQAAELAAIKIKGQEAKIVDSFYKMPLTATPAQAEKIEAQRRLLTTAYDEIDDNQNFRGTAWGMVNAFSDVFTHNNPMKQVKNRDENHFMQVSLSTHTMNNFVEHVRKFAI